MYGSSFVENYSYATENNKNEAGYFCRSEDLIPLHFSVWAETDTLIDKITIKIKDIVKRPVGAISYPEKKPMEVVWADHNFSKKTLQFDERFCSINKTQDYFSFVLKFAVSSSTSRSFHGLVYYVDILDKEGDVIASSEKMLLRLGNYLPPNMPVVVWVYLSNIKFPPDKFGKYVLRINEVLK